MMVIAMRSSTTARVSRNDRSADGRCVAITARTARAKAMSVAVGIAQPRNTSPSPPASNAVPTKSSAGTATPHTAAAIGSAALLRSDRSPATNSRLSSIPATRKNTASSPSAAHVPRLRSRCKALGPTTVSRRLAYASRHGELAQIKAATAADSRMAPPTVSCRRTSATYRASRQVPRPRIRLIGVRSLGALGVAWSLTKAIPPGSSRRRRPDFPAHHGRAHRRPTGIHLSAAGPADGGGIAGAVLTLFSRYVRFASSVGRVANRTIGAWGLIGGSDRYLVLRGKRIHRHGLGGAHE